ncbi:PREDICTED: complement decay-accelerating factor isoform X2 [Chinchilla lanigera]|uniref:complement decay-accelerating factor isoform X2 n=1 Tax=Chinchilla lanigera TaxID=34839 RepID=UPI0006973A32|nr:PREDICTED: complement decay-accelerating factor isoform X2 [Chinchilla lanigera]
MRAAPLPPGSSAPAAASPASRRRRRPRPRARAMSPARPRGPAAPRRRPALLLGAPALLGLLLRAAAVRGDCGLPPVIPHAQPALGGHTSFPENTTVSYTCDSDFVKIPGMADAVICLSSNQWTDIEEFCNRSCEVPPKLSYAALKKTYISKNYFPVGTVVEYECRPGYKRKMNLLSGRLGALTCLDNLTWSIPETFCEKKQCGNPGDILHGYINITTDLLFGSQIFFFCDTGYRLNGPTSAFCMLVGNGVGWSDRLPVCTKILCPEPPKIQNGRIINEEDTYSYRQVVTYECDRGFTLTGEKNLYCTVMDDTGEWSGPAPTCRGKSSYPSRPTLKPHTTNTPATKRGPDPRTSTKPPTTAPEEKGLASGYSGVIYGVVIAGITITGSLVLAKFLWNRGKSGTQLCKIGSSACGASNHQLADRGKEELRETAHLRRIVLVCYKFLEQHRYNKSGSALCFACCCCL